MRGSLLLLLGIALAAAACEPDAWSPAAEHRREVDGRAARLSAHLATLPGIARASVVLDEPFADPLAPPPAPATASIILALAPGADADATTAAARTAVAGAVPGLDPARVTIVAAAPPPSERMVDVGPFRVSAGSRSALITTLAVALLVIAGLGGWIAALGLRHRPVS